MGVDTMVKNKKGKIFIIGACFIIILLAINWKATINKAASMYAVILCWIKSNFVAIVPNYAWKPIRIQTKKIQHSKFLVFFAEAQV